jgi:hypothetical protein
LSRAVPVVAGALPIPYHCRSTQRDADDDVELGFIAMPPDARTRSILKNLLLSDVFAAEARELRCASTQIFEEFRERWRRLECPAREIISIAKCVDAAVAQILAKFEALERQRLERPGESGFFSLGNEIWLIEKSGRACESRCGGGRNEKFCLHVS